MEKGMIAMICTVMVSLVYSSTTPSTHGGLPPQDQLRKIVNASFANVDTDNDGFIEKYEFDTIVIIADSDDNGCMSEQEYERFSAGTPTIARAIYEHFDVNKTDCLTVDKVAGQFSVMDLDTNGEVTPLEFQDYYIGLLNILFP